MKGGPEPQAASNSRACPVKEMSGCLSVMPSISYNSMIFRSDAPDWWELRGRARFNHLGPKLS